MALAIPKTRHYPFEILKGILRLIILKQSSKVLFNEKRAISACLPRGSSAKAIPPKPPPIVITLLILFFLR